MRTGAIHLVGSVWRWVLGEPNLQNVGLQGFIIPEWAAAGLEDEDEEQ